MLSVAPIPVTVSAHFSFHSKSLRCLIAFCSAWSSEPITTMCMETSLRADF
jgi:hypothetical protein